MTEELLPAPELDVVDWLNGGPHSLRALRGRVVVLHAFQMLCPGCVLHGIPQAQKIQRIFPPEELAVIGLHSVFEHHAAMQRTALEVFLQEFGIRFPVAIDRHDSGEPIPRTMRAYGMRGTPTLILIDRVGRLRARHLGQIEDIALGAQIGTLLAEPAAA